MSDPTDGPGRRSGRPDDRIVSRERVGLTVGAAIGVMALRTVMSLDARFPRVLADEAAYLGMARLLARGERWDLGLASTYGFGYSVLIAPWFALGLSPEATYRAAIATNVVLAGLTFLALVALARRTPGVGHRLAVGLAAVAASLPALVTTTRFAWSDDLAPLVFALLLLLLARTAEEPTPLNLGALALVAGGGYAVHGRFLVLVPVVMAVLVVLAAAGRIRWWQALVEVLGLAWTVSVVQMISAAITRRLYDPMQVTQGLNQADRLARPLPVVEAVLGQGWYLVVTTAGVAGLGAAALGVRWWRSTAAVRAGAGDEHRPTLRRRVVALGQPDALLLTATVGMVVTGFLASVVFMTDRPRGDHQVYGRYNDLFVGPLVVWGGAALATVSPRRLLTALGAVAVTTVLAATVVWTTRRDELRAGHLVFPVLGLVALDPDGPPALPGITAVALAMAAGLVLGAVTLPRRVVPGAVVAVTLLLCVVGSVRAGARLDRTAVADPGDAAVMADVVAPGGRVAWLAGDEDNPIASSFYADQLYLPDAPSVRVVGEPWTAGEAYVVAGARRPEPPAAGYRLAWVEPGSSLGLWVAPGPRQDELAGAGRLLAPGIVGSTAGDEGVVRFVGRPDVTDGRLRADVTVDRPEGTPWATVGPGGDPSGRVRLLVTAEGVACRCPVVAARVDVGRWVPAEDTTLDLAVDIGLPADAPGDLVVTAQLLREGVARFGDEARATTG